MGYVLLWIESLAVSLLLVATVAACLAHLRPARWRWLGQPLAVLVALVPLLFYAGLTAIVAWFHLQHVAGGYLLFAMIMLTTAYTLGAGWMLFRELGRRLGQEPVWASDWPRGRLALALFVAAALHLMTFWNLDLAARQQLATLRTEAGALALSVAPPRLPDGDNAMIVYQQAFAAMGRDETSPNVWNWEKPWRDAWSEKWATWQGSEKIGFDLHDPELRRFLKWQSSALALLRQAATKPGCSFDRDYGRPSIAMILPELQPLREAALLLALDAICRADDKDYRGALLDVNAMFRMAEHISTDPILVSMLVTAAIDRSAINALRHVLASGQVPPADLAAVHVPDGMSYRAMLRRGYRQEEAFRLATFGQIGDGQISLAELSAPSPTDLSP